MIKKHINQQLQKTTTQASIRNKTTRNAIIEIYISSNNSTGFEKLYECAKMTKIQTEKSKKAPKSKDTNCNCQAN